MRQSMRPQHTTHAVNQSIEMGSWRGAATLGGRLVGKSHDRHHHSLPQKGSICRAVPIFTPETGLSQNRAFSTSLWACLGLGLHLDTHGLAFSRASNRDSGLRILLLVSLPTRCGYHSDLPDARFRWWLLEH